MFSLAYIYLLHLSIRNPCIFHSVTIPLLKYAHAISTYFSAPL